MAAIKSVILSNGRNHCLSFMSHEKNSISAVLHRIMAQGLIFFYVGGLETPARVTSTQTDQISARLEKPFIADRPRAVAFTLCLLWKLRYRLSPDSHFVASPRCRAALRHACVGGDSLFAVRKWNAALRSCRPDGSEVCTEFEALENNGRLPSLNISSF